MTTPRKRICLFFDRTYVDAHPCFREMAVQFLENGWEVDLYATVNPDQPSPVFGSRGIRFYVIRHSKAGLLKLLAKMVWGRYRAIVATPSWALYWAVRIGKLRRVPVVCLSDEVFPQEPDRNDLRRMSRSDYVRWKKKENWAHARCVLTVALGEERFLLAKKENRLPEGHAHVIVPNAPAGNGKRTPSAYYRDALNIPKDHAVLLHSGSLWGVLLKPLAETVRRSPEPVTVVIQSRSEGPKPDWLNERVKLSGAVLPYARMREITSSADIGLMLYDRTHPEESRNGNTAGKLGLYLSCGLPVICCNLEIFKWVEKEGCGVWVPDVASVPEAAKKIMSDYERYSRNAVRVFDRDFEYSRHFKVFLGELEKRLKN